MHSMSILLHVTRLLVTHDSSLVKACSITVPVPRWLRFHLQTSAPLVFFFDGAMTSFGTMENVRRTSLFVLIYVPDFASGTIKGSALSRLSPNLAWTHPKEKLH